MSDEFMKFFSGPDTAEKRRIVDVAEMLGGLLYNFEARVYRAAEREDPSWRTGPVSTKLNLSHLALYGRFAYSRLCRGQNPRLINKPETGIATIKSDLCLLIRQVEICMKLELGIERSALTGATWTAYWHGILDQIADLIIDAARGLISGGVCHVGECPDVKKMDPKKRFDGTFVPDLGFEPIQARPSPRGIRRLARRVCPVCSEFAESRCGGCRRVGYCSSGCQAEHWPVHKRVCAEEKGKAPRVEAKAPKTGKAGPERAGKGAGEIGPLKSGTHQAKEPRCEVCKGASALRCS